MFFVRGEIASNRKKSNIFVLRSAPNMTHKIGQWLWPGDADSFALVTGIRSNKFLIPSFKRVRLSIISTYIKTAAFKALEVMDFTYI